MLYLAIAIAGGAGCLLRYLIDKSVPNGPFPLSTFLINMAGSFLLGLIYVLGTEKGFLTKELAAISAAGFLGGFTTFSAFSLQTVMLMESGQAAIAAAYFILSPALSALSAFAGIWITRTLA